MQMATNKSKENIRTVAGTLSEAALALLQPMDREASLHELLLASKILLLSTEALNLYASEES